MPLNSMALAVSEVVLPKATKTTQEPGEGCKRIHEVNPLGIDVSKIPVKEESQEKEKEKEKQISVDPISLREPSFNLMLPPVITSLRDPTVPLPLPPLLHPAKPRFISCSLPNSTTSSPKFSSILSKKKWKNEGRVENLVRQHSTSSTHSRFSLPHKQDNMFGRSKSYGEGRACAPMDELDLFLQRPNATVSVYKKMPLGSFCNKDVIPKTRGNNVDPLDEEFKCGSLCLFLPGFGKTKPVRVRPSKEEVGIENVISRTVSLEKFECGSWASSAIINDQDHDHGEDGDSLNLYFDLPLELIRNSVNDAHSPINAAFVFDKDVKGVLKTASTSTRASGRKSHESSRHVRFSVSSPASPASCITPRLRKAREDFNAFLEAQSA